MLGVAKWEKFSREIWNLQYFVVLATISKCQFASDVRMYSFRKKIYDLFFSWCKILHHTLRCILTRFWSIFHAIIDLIPWCISSILKGNWPLVSHRTHKIKYFCYSNLPICRGIFFGIHSLINLSLSSSSFKSLAGCCCRHLCAAKNVGASGGARARVRQQW